MRADRLVILTAAAVLVGAFPLSATAGDADHEIEDHEGSPPFFGETKDIDGLKPLPGVRIKTTLRGTMRFLVGTSDEEGNFKIRGLGDDIVPESVDVTCEKDGYRTVDVTRRRVAPVANAPTAVECLLERKPAGK